MNKYQWNSIFPTNCFLVHEMDLHDSIFFHINVNCVLRQLIESSFMFTPIVIIQPVVSQPFYLGHRRAIWLLDVVLEEEYLPRLR